MAYALENALFQWEEGERRLRAAPEPDRLDLERAVEAVTEALRRRLGSSFAVGELVAMYGAGTDWATSAASREPTGGDAAWVVDAAFYRYAREATDFAGGRPQER